MTGTSALRRRPLPWLWGGDRSYGRGNPDPGLLLLFTTEDLFVRRRQRLLLFVSDSPLRESETVPLGSRGSGASAQGTENLVFFLHKVFFFAQILFRILFHACIF